MVGDHDVRTLRGQVFTPDNFQPVIELQPAAHEQRGE